MESSSPDHQNLQLELEQTVIKILKSSNLDTATELSVRNDAQKLLGVDLSDLASKQLVRRVLESYLLSTSPLIEEPVDRIICRLPGMSRVSVKNFEGSKSVSIRKYFEKLGKVFPLGQGITLNPEEWSAFHSSFPDIEEAITKMQSRTREEQGNGRKQTVTKASYPSTSMASQPHGRVKLQTGAETSVFPPQQLIPIATTRFTGKNYYCWKRQMEFFINQLKISHVLVTSCPEVHVSPQASFEEITEAKTYAQKWINDDYICRHAIMNSLSDQLFDEYSVKTLNAKELWDTLKLLYDEDFGTNISHVNNYLQFQMIDGVSVLEQVHELHRIAGTITASGIHIDERFHVGVIISKLPSSWKHIRPKLMQEEHLSLDKLIYILKDEEDSRSQQKRNNGLNKDPKRLCFGCHKEGHIQRDCPSRRSYRRDG
uniref:Putative zinc knuckle (CCHC-type) family protein n=1 Tax=Tanacetum cinerariifolium TaxID=118510 RepID=A0A6L2KQG9_TANCI|nr:putative zinc knuckle (CCHC-type) family protein [Tanacetum cinerariifolium]